jgi:hydroxymethylpyrimidine pyrophosphatase-like HAD family hydrolase
MARAFTIPMAIWSSLITWIDIASDLFGVVHNNPDIVTNVYRDDEWFMNRHRPDEMRFFKEAIFQYSLYEPGMLELRVSAKSSSPAKNMNNCFRWSRRLMPVGAIA